MPSIYLFSSVKYLFISFPRFQHSLFLLWLGGSVSSVCLFFFSTLESSPDFRDLMYLDPTFCPAFTASASLVGMNALATEHSRALARPLWLGPDCPARVARQMSLEGGGESGNQPGTTDCSAWSSCISPRSFLWALHRRADILAQEEESAFLGPYFWWNA